VVSNRWVAPVDHDWDAPHELVVDGARRVQHLSPAAWFLLTRALRQSVRLYGPVRAGEVIALPFEGEAVDFPPGVVAKVRTPRGGDCTASHAAGEYDEGFEPVTRSTPVPR
jgi:hypothetical protein